MAKRQDYSSCIAAFTEEHKDKTIIFPIIFRLYVWYKKENKKKKRQPAWAQASLKLQVTAERY